MTLASRIGVMNRGEIVQVGTPTDIYEYPTTGSSPTSSAR